VRPEILVKGLGSLAWLLVALALIGPALILGVPADPATSPWALSPSQGWRGLHPWSLLSPAWVHATARHELFNLLGAGLLGALGWALRAPPRAALAWLVAWPLTHALLMMDPRLGWYVGASGVLHAGLAVLIVHLWRRQRGLAATLAALLLGKVLLDVASGLPLADRAGLDVPMVPLAHLFGVLAGFVAAGFHHDRISRNDRN
jgi:rhomboid family GlyGly-CTERM serine protease